MKECEYVLGDRGSSKALSYASAHSWCQNNVSENQPFVKTRNLFPIDQGISTLVFVKSLASASDLAPYHCLLWRNEGPERQRG